MTMNNELYRKQKPELRGGSDRYHIPIIGQMKNEFKKYNKSINFGHKSFIYNKTYEAKVKILTF